MSTQPATEKQTSTQKWDGSLGFQLAKLADSGATPADILCAFTKNVPTESDSQAESMARLLYSEVTRIENSFKPKKKSSEVACTVLKALLNTVDYELDKEYQKLLKGKVFHAYKKSADKVVTLLRKYSLDAELEAPMLYASKFKGLLRHVNNRLYNENSILKREWRYFVTSLTYKCNAIGPKALAEMVRHKDFEEAKLFYERFSSATNSIGLKAPPELEEYMNNDGKKVQFEPKGPRTPQYEMREAVAHKFIRYPRQFINMVGWLKREGIIGIHCAWRPRSMDPFNYSEDVQMLQIGTFNTVYMIPVKHFSLPNHFKLWSRLFSRIFCNAEICKLVFNTKAPGSGGNLYNLIDTIYSWGVWADPIDKFKLKSVLDIKTLVTTMEARGKGTFPEVSKTTKKTSGLSVQARVLFKLTGKWLDERAAFSNWGAKRLSNQQVNYAKEQVCSLLDMWTWCDQWARNQGRAISEFMH